LPFVSESIGLGILIFGVSVLYAAVGQAGGSGYLAVMAFTGTPPEVMRPTALLLNVLVAGAATLRYHRAGLFDLSATWPLLLGSVPLAAIGGAVQLSREIFNPLVGLILLVSAVPLVASKGIAARAVDDRGTQIPMVPALVAGAGIGLLAGLTGTGGGIFLSPLLLAAGWASARRAAATTTAFILANSSAALAANATSVRTLPEALPLWAVAVVVGGLIGGELGSRWLPTRVLLRLLALTLVVAGLKLCFWP
jgi:uncharacterized protein